MFTSRRSVLFAAAGFGSGFGSSVAAASTPPADLYSRDGNGRSLFLLACLAGKADEIEGYVQRGIRLDIHEAAAAGKMPRVEEILALNPGSVNHRDLLGATPLHYAAACGHVAMANLLLGRGADLNAKAPGLAGATPAHGAAEFADPVVAMQLAQTIVGNGADPQAATDDGTTLLDLAERRNHADMVAFLTRRGTRHRDVNRDETHGIPQSWINQFVTVSHFDLDQVKRLHGQCSDLLLTRSTWDEIGVEAGAHMGREDIAHFFVDRGAPVSLCTATMLGETDEVKKLLAEDASRVQDRGAHDFPLLWYTVFGKERADLAQLLIAAGADPHAGMMGGKTLDLARKKKYRAVEEILIKAGA